MKHLHLLVLIMVIGSALWLGGCASVASTTAHPEVLTTADFSINSGKWFNAVEFDKANEQKKLEMNAPGPVQELYDTMLKNTRPMEIQMKSERGQYAFVELGFYFKNPNTNISFHTGGLILTLKGPQGISEVRDRGCLFAYYEGRKGICYDSAREVVNFNRNFNNQPKGRKPNIIWVRLDPQYSNWELVALTIDPQKISLQSPVASRVP